MATITNITTSYAGEFAGKYISAALLSASTIENGGIEVKPNVKFKEVIKKLDTDALLKDATCDFDPTSTVTLTERILQPEEFQVNLQLCKSDFESDWEAVQMGYSSFDSLPPAFADFLLAHVAAKTAQKTEKNIWSGVNANAGEFDGLVTLATADAAVIDVVGTTVDASNVIAELGKIVDAIPSAVYGKEDLSLYVSQNIARAYVRALGGFAAAGLGANGTNAMGTQWYNNGSLSFDGVKIFVANGLADNTAMAAEKSNLYFGTGLLSDHNEVKVIDMADIDGSKNVRVVMRFSAGVQYGIGSDIVLYS
jgi:phosphotransferase system HPr-like phosphotransfer protein